MESNMTIVELESELQNNLLLHGKHHVSSAITYNNMGSVYFNNNDYNKAYDCYESALKIALNNLGEDHEYVIDTRYRMGRVLEAKSSSEEKNNEMKNHKMHTFELRSKHDMKIKEQEGELVAQQAIEKYKNINSEFDQDTSDMLRIIDDPVLARRYSLDDMDSTLIYNDIAEEFRLDGNLDKAQALYVRSIELRRKKFGNDSPSLSQVLLNYAELLRQQSNFEAAKVVLEEALAINMKAFGMQHRQTADVLNNLGQIYRFLGNLSRSKQLLIEALKVRKTLFGDFDLTVGACLNNLAELYREMQDYQEAINYHNLAIEAFEAAAGSDHPGTINAKGNLGITLRRYSKVNAEMGENLIEDTVKYLHSHNYHENHPWLVKFGSENLITAAQRLADQGHHEQSLEMYEKLLNDKQISPIKYSSPLTPSTTAVALVRSSDNQVPQELQLIGKGKFTSMLGKIKSLINKGKFIESKEILKECSEFSFELLGSNEEKSVLYAEMKYLATENAFRSSDYESVEALRVETLQLLIDLYGPESEKLVYIMLLIGESYRATGSYDEAETFLNEAINLISSVIRKEQATLGKATSTQCIIYIRANVELADLHRNIGAYDVASPLLTEALDICHDNLLEDEVVMGECYTSLAAIECIRGNYLKSMEYHQLALDNRIKNFGKNHPKTAASLAHISRLHFINCEFSSAARLIQESNNIREQFFLAIDPAHPALTNGMYLTAKLHHSQNELDQAEEVMSKVLELRKKKFGTTHASVAQAMHALGEILVDKYKLVEGLDMLELALQARKEIFITHPHHNDITQTIATIAYTKSLQGKYLEAVEMFDECIKLRKVVMDIFGIRFHFDFSNIMLKYGIVLLAIGRINDSAKLFGQSGADCFQLFQSEQHLRIADGLYHVANASKALGQYKNAKYQYSTCMAIRYRYLGKYHPDVLMILYASADNMRLVGYFQDALLTCCALEVLLEKINDNKKTLLHTLALKLRADILCDRGMYTKAEPLYKSALEQVIGLYGDNCYHAIEIQYGICRCLQSGPDQVEKETLYRKLGSLAKKVLGAEAFLTQEIISNLAMTKLNRRPEEGSTCLNTLKEQLLPFFTSNYGKNHPYTIHTQGRIGLFMNMLKKDSGRKLVQKSLQAFDEYKQFNFTQDHPWVLELGGYLTRSSQERLSHVIEIQALTSWCMPKFEGDVSYGQTSRTFWLDVSNNNPEYWGMLHFYGAEQVSVDGVLPIIAEAKHRENGSVPILKQQKKRDQADDISLSDTQIDLSELSNVATTLEIEIKARKDAEDLLIVEVENRKILEEQLEAEQDAKRIADENLIALQIERENLVFMYEESMKKIKELGETVKFAAENGAPQVFEVKVLDQVVEVIDNNFVENAKENLQIDHQEEINSSNEVVEEKEEKIEILNIPEIEGGLNIELSQNIEKVSETENEDYFDHNELNDITTKDVDIQKNEIITSNQIEIELNACVFLHTRATALLADGYFTKSLPLLEECLRVRSMHEPIEISTLSTMMELARNFLCMHKWDEALSFINKCLNLNEKKNGIDNIHYSIALFIKSEILLSKGMYIDASKLFSRLVKNLSKQVDKEKGDKKKQTQNEIGIILGKALCMLGFSYLKTGKLAEAKASVERGYAMLSKQFDLKSILINDAMIIKCEILMYSSKYKEAFNLLDQIISFRKQLLGDYHHTLYKCLLLYGISLCEVGKFIEAQGKFNAAKIIVLEFFDETSLEYASVLYCEAQLSYKLCRYEESLKSHLQALQIRKTLTWESYPDLSDSYQALGVLFTRMAYFQEAMEYLNHALDIRSRFIIDNTTDKSSNNNSSNPIAPHPLLADTKCAQGDLLRLRGDYISAKVLMDESLESRQILFGKENADYLTGQHLYGLLLQDMGDLTNAEKLNKRTIKGRRQILGDDHPDLAVSLLSQSEVLLALGCFGEAMELKNEAQSIVKLNYSDHPIHINVIQFEILNGMERMLQLEKQHADAEDDELQKQIEQEKVMLEIAKSTTTTNNNNNIGENKPTNLTKEKDLTLNTEATPGFYSKKIENDNSNIPQQEDVEKADMNIVDEKVLPSDEESLLEDSKAAVVPASVVIVDVVPVFNNIPFVEVCTYFENAVNNLKLLYHQNKNTTQTIIPTLPTDLIHPLIIFLEGVIGNTLLLEYLSKRRFIEGLSPTDRELFLSRESFKRLQNKEILLKPNGLPEIEKAIEALINYPLFEHHVWLKKLNDARENIKFVLDDMEVAANSFIEAEELRKKGNFTEADKLYDEVFLTQVQALGPVQASSSLVVAETLYSKAINSCSLGEIELSKELFNQSVSIFRKQLGNENEGVMKGILGLTDILTYQGLHDDAYSMHTRVLQAYVDLFGDQSVQVARIRSLLAFDLYKLGKFNQALKMGMQAYQQLNTIPLSLNNNKTEDLAQVRLYIAQIQLALGQFVACKESIDLAQSFLDPNQNIETNNSKKSRPGTGVATVQDVRPTSSIESVNMIAISAVLEVQAEYLLAMNKIFEAHKVITTAMKQRIKSYGRTNKISEVNRNPEKKRLFYETLDNLSVETSKKVDENDDDDENNIKNIKKNEVKQVKQSKEDERDNELETEMRNAVADDLISHSSSLEASMVPSVSSFIRFGGLSKVSQRPALLHRGVPVQSHPLIADCLFLKGKISLTLGYYAEAKEMLDAAINMLTTFFSRPSQKKLSISHELADLCFKKGNIEEARTLHTSILQQRLQILEEEHPDKAESLFKIACINIFVSKFDDSTQILTEALNIRKKVYGESHWKVAEVLAECAIVLHYKGLHTDSDSLFDKALVISKHYFGDLHLLTANIQVGQAANARECGLYEQANAFMEQAKSTRLILVGDTHPDTAACMYYQSMIMRCLGRILDAKKLLDNSIIIQREKLGKYHPLTAMTLLSMAINFMDLAKFSVADHVYNRSLTLLRKSVGKDHILIALGIVGMAENSKLQGKYEESKKLHEQALYLRRKLLGDRHHSIAESIYYISELHLILANYEEATKGFDDALAIQKMALGQSHPSIATSMHGLGKVLLAQGKIGDAKHAHDRAFLMRRTCLPADHPEIGDSQFCNALVYRKLGKFEQANALFERCLTTVRDSRGARHPLVASIIYNSGEISVQMGRFHQAEALLLEALKIRFHVYKEININHPDIVESYFGLAENLRMRGYYDFIEDSEKKIPEMKKILKVLNLNKTTTDPTTTADHNNQHALYDDDSNATEKADLILKTLLNEEDIVNNTEPDNELGKNPSQEQPRFDPIMDDATAPTVGISVIEQLERVDNNKNNNIDEETILDEHSITDFNAFIENPRKYKALPIINQVLTQLAFCYTSEHPIFLQVQFVKAENLKHMGKYEEALELHESLLASRRKLFGDNHFDVVSSMLALAQCLQCIGKVYPESNGSLDAKEVRKAKQGISLGVSLMDHLNSLASPLQVELSEQISRPSTSNKPITATGKRDQQIWGFLSKPETDAKKKTPLKLPKGYMGYQFPAIKKIVRQENISVTRPKKVRSGDAKWLLDSSITVQKRVFGETSEHPTTATSLFYRGELFRARGDYHSAMQQYEAALIMRRKLYRGNHPCIADCLNSMAELFRIENKFKQALPMYDKALEIRMEAFEGLHPSIAESRNNLAMLAFSEGRFADAQKHFESSLDICEQLLGNSHPSTAFCLNNLAALLHASGQYHLALPLYLKTLKIKQKTFGEHHIEVASVINNLGLIYKTLGKYEEAESKYLEALELQRKLFGSTNKDVATTLNNLASLYAIQGKTYKAKEMYKESVTMRSALFGLEHPTVAATLNNFAGLLFTMGEYEEAKDYFEDALRIRKKIYGESHPTVAETLNNIGLLLYTQGNLKEALPVYENALEIKRLAYGEMNPSVATSLNNLAGVYHKLGHFDRAIALYRSAFEIRKLVLGEVHDETLIVEENLKVVMNDKKKWTAVTNSGLLLKKN